MYGTLQHSSGKKQVFDSQAKCTVGSEKTINGSQHNISLVACHLYSPFFSCLFLATPFPLSFQNKRQKTHFSVSPFPKTPLQKSRGCHVFEAFTPLYNYSPLFFWLPFFYFVHTYLGLHVVNVRLVEEVRYSKVEWSKYKKVWGGEGSKLDPGFMMEKRRGREGDDWNILTV